MSVTLSNVGAITLFIEDRDRSKKFYQDVFALAPIFEDEDSVAFKFDNIVINLLEASEAHSLIDPATVAPQTAGARFQLTAEVDDMDIECAQLALLGVPLLNGPMDRPWGMRTASFTDPDGHIWEIAHELTEAAEVE
jgi:lactoylglutathione lyase